MSAEKGFERYFERIKSEEPVCRCGYIRRREQQYGKCPSKGKDGNCYLKTGTDCKYAKKLKERNLK